MTGTHFLWWMIAEVSPGTAAGNQWSENKTRYFSSVLLPDLFITLFDCILYFVSQYAGATTNVWSLQRRWERYVVGGPYLGGVRIATKSTNWEAKSFTTVDPSLTCSCNDSGTGHLNNHCDVQIMWLSNPSSVNVDFGFANCLIIGIQIVHRKSFFRGRLESTEKSRLDSVGICFFMWRNSVPRFNFTVTVIFIFRFSISIWYDTNYRNMLK